MARTKKMERERREWIEDTFFDMSFAEQLSLLATLNTLHRLKSRQVEDEDEPKANGVENAAGAEAVTA